MVNMAAITISDTKAGPRQRVFDCIVMDMSFSRRVVNQQSTGSATDALFQNRPQWYAKLDPMTKPDYIIR
jgi:hypothetical protein